MVDLHGNVSSGASKVGHLVLYGAHGFAPDVPTSVYDALFSVANVAMTMETNLNMNNKNLINTNRLIADEITASSISTKQIQGTLTVPDLVVSKITGTAPAITTLTSNNVTAPFFIYGAWKKQQQCYKKL